MAMHTFWEVTLTDHKDRVIPQKIMAHAVGLPLEEEAVIDHLRRHNFPKAKDIKVKPADGLINFHGYPVKHVPGGNHSHLGYNENGERVDLIGGGLVGPDGESIQVDHKEMIAHPENPGQAEQRKAPSATPSSFQSPKVAPR